MNQLTGPIPESLSSLTRVFWLCVRESRLGALVS